MKNTPLLQQVLGKDWDKLPSVIQQHYCVPEYSFTQLKGTMEIGYPNFLLPLIYFIHLLGGLVLKRGKSIETTVKKTVSDDNKYLLWHRSLQYSPHKTDYFYSKMSYLKANELIESIGFGFGLRLKVTVEEDKLVYRSHGHFWQCGSLRLIFPDWLLLGQATIIESAISKQQFKLDFNIKHPLWGNSYWYFGVFNYQP